MNTTRPLSGSGIFFRNLMSILRSILPPGTRRHRIAKNLYHSTRGFLEPAQRNGTPSRHFSNDLVPRYTAICSGLSLVGTCFSWDGKPYEHQPLQLLKNKRASVCFQAPENGLREVSFLLGTYDRVNASTLTLELFEVRDEGEKIVRTTSIDARRVLNNLFQVFAFEQIEDSADKWYNATLYSPDADPDNAVALWVSQLTTGPEVLNSLSSHPKHDMRSFIDQSHRFVDVRNFNKEECREVFIPRYRGICTQSPAFRTTFSFEGDPFEQFVVAISPDIPFSFFFFCPEERLSALEIAFGTYGRSNQCTIKFELYELGERKEFLRHQQTIPAQLLENNRFYNFTFDPIPDSRQKWFRACISSPDSTAINIAGLYGRVVQKDSGLYDNLKRRGEKRIVSAIDTIERGVDVPRYLDTPHAMPARLLNDQPLEARHVLVIADETMLLSGRAELHALCQLLRSSGIAVSLLSKGSFWEKMPQAETLDLVIGAFGAVDEESARVMRAMQHASLPVGLYVGAAASYRTDAGADSTAPSKAEEKERQKQAKLIAQMFRGVDFLCAIGDILFPHVDGSAPVFSLTDKPSLESFMQRVTATLRNTRLPKVSIVSILYAKERELPFFLDALMRQNYRGPLELLLVDDRSPDKSSALAAAYFERLRRDTPEQTLPELVLIENKTNIGNCGSRNEALRRATGEIVIIVDADCILNSRFVQAHVDAHLVGDCDVAVGPYNIETEGFEPLPFLKHLEDNSTYVDEKCDLQDTINKPSFLNCITRNFSIRKSFVKGELFDPLFAYSADPSSGFGWEDVEMGYRLYERAARIKYLPQAFSVHVSHPASVDERTKPLRSLLNFRRLIEKHPQIALTARRWTLDSYEKIVQWVDSHNHPADDNRQYLEKRFESNLPYRYKIKRTRRLKILTYRWHCPHQYELYKLPHDFSLITNLGTGFTAGWNFTERPLPSNAKLLSLGDINPKDYDAAILHFDENVLSAHNTNGVIGDDWGANFRWMRENIKLPMAAICHGTPQFYGQYNPDYSGERLGEVIEAERKKLVDFVGDMLVINNSHQAFHEWGFQNAKVIWQGFDPTEFPLSNFRKGILTLGQRLVERPVYRGYYLYRQVFADFPKEWMPDGTVVAEPEFWHEPSTNSFGYAKFRNYVDTLREYAIYFNPTLRSPMPRARGEAMMCGLVTVSANNHDVEMFIKNTVNGFYSNDPLELREYLLYLLRHPDEARAIGMRGRAVALDVFNHDRYLKTWEDTLNQLTA